MAANRGLRDQRLFTTWFLCAVDGRDHAVEDAEFAAGRDRGLCRAICGHLVSVASAAEPNGPLCPVCLTWLRSTAPSATAPREVKQRRALFRCLTRRRQAPVASASCPNEAVPLGGRPDPAPGGGELRSPCALAITGDHAAGARR